MFVCGVGYEEAASKTAEVITVVEEDVNVVEGWVTVIGYEVVKIVVLVVKCLEEKAGDVEGLGFGGKLSI